MARPAGALRSRRPAPRPIPALVVRVGLRVTWGSAWFASVRLKDILAEAIPEYTAPDRPRVAPAFWRSAPCSRWRWQPARDGGGPCSWRHGLSLVLYSLPAFWLALMLQFVFAYQSPLASRVVDSPPSGLSGGTTAVDRGASPSCHARVCPRPVRRGVGGPNAAGIHRPDPDRGLYPDGDCEGACRADWSSGSMPSVRHRSP